MIEYKQSQLDSEYQSIFRADNQIQRVLTEMSTRQLKEQESPVLEIERSENVEQFRPPRSG